MQIVMTYNQARHFQNYIVTQIEHQNQLNHTVYELIDEGQKYCTSCSFNIHKNNDRYEVTVTFPIHIHLIDYHTNGVTRMMTQIIK